MYLVLLLELQSDRIHRGFATCERPRDTMGRKTLHSGNSEVRTPAGRVLLPALAVAPLVMIIAASATLALAPRESTLPFRLVEKVTHRIGPEEAFFVADVDLDGTDDVLIAGKIHALWYRPRGSNLVVREEINYRLAGTPLGILDVTGDGRPEFFISMQTPEGVLVACHDWFSEGGPSNPIYTLGPFLPPLPRDNAWAEGRVLVMNAFDSDGNGRRELYLSIEPFHARPAPRALLAVDGPTGDELWRFEMGPPINGVQLLSRGGEEPRIIVSTYSSGNGAVWNGTADTLSYVFSLTPGGGLNWARPVTGHYSASRVEIVDLDGDGMEDILVSRRFGPIEDAETLKGEPWTVAVLHPEDGRFVRAARLRTGAVQTLSVDLDRDFHPEVLVTGIDGRFFMLEHNLATRRVLDGGSQTQLGDVVDLDGDGSREIVGWGPGSLIVRDEDADLKATTSIDDVPQPEIAAVVGGKDFIARLHIDFLRRTAVFAPVEGHRYVVARNGGAVRFYALEPSQPSPSAGWIASGRLGVALVVLGGGLGVAGMLAGIVIRGRLRHRRAALAVPDEIQEDLLGAMVAFGHGGASLKVLDRIRFFLKNWDRRSAARTHEGDPMASVGKAFGESVVPDLRRIVFLARRAGVSSVHWKPILAHSSHAVQGIGRVFGSGPTARSSDVRDTLEHLDGVDECLSGVRAHLREQFRAPVVSTTMSVIARRREDLERTKTRFTLRVNGAFEDSGFIARPVLEKVLDGLLTNALRAMEGVESRRIELAMENEGAYLRLDFTDTGCGISEEDREKVFDRHFSTKPGGGFGLHYAREELAKFGGRVFVQESVPGEGTTFRVIVRRSESA